MKFTTDVAIRNVKTTRELLGNEQARQQLQTVARGLDAGKIMRAMAGAMITNDGLNGCNPMSVLSSAMASVSLGLSPNTAAGEAYILPYGKKAQLIIGYRGMLTLLSRSTAVGAIHADIVRDGDDFSYSYGSRAHLDHTPRVDEGDPTHAYAHAKMTDGTENFVVLRWSEVEKIRGESSGYRTAIQKKSKDTPWIKWEKAMAQKTAIRALFKHMPVRDETLDNALAADEGFGSAAMATEVDVEPAMRVAHGVDEERKPMTQRGSVSTPKRAAKAAKPAAKPAEEPVEAAETVDVDAEPVVDAPGVLERLTADLDAAEDPDDVKAITAQYKSEITALPKADVAKARALAKKRMDAVKAAVDEEAAF